MSVNNKDEIRRIYRKIRKDIDERKRLNFNNSIFNHFINSHYFNDYDTILCYVSVNDEVDTRCLIKYILDAGKNLYIPKCVGKDMFFYRLTDINNLIDGEFGIPTVDTASLISLKSFDNVLCIVPAICFDKKGYRTGYGGGYYDRFLAEKRIETVGLCYDECICDVLPKNNFDIQVDNVLTETGFKITKL